MTDNERADLEAKVADLQSQLKFYKTQLVEAHQMTAVGQLLAGIVHEINTPIGSVLSNNQVSARSLEMLRQFQAEDDRARKAIDQLTKS